MTTFIFLLQIVFSHLPLLPSSCPAFLVFFKDTLHTNIQRQNWKKTFRKPGDLLLNNRKVRVLRNKTQKLRGGSRVLHTFSSTWQNSNKVIILKVCCQDFNMNGKLKHFIPYFIHGEPMDRYHHNLQLPSGLKSSNITR